MFEEYWKYFKRVLQTLAIMQQPANDIKYIENAACDRESFKYASIQNKT